MSRINAAILIMAITGAILASSASLCAASNIHYNEAMKEVRALSGSPNIRLLHFGSSYENRGIPAFVISDFSSKMHDKTRIFICAGQHGDENAPVKSVLSLCKKIASNLYPKLLSQCVFIVVPVANPDGLVLSQRLNAQGLDINRDWSELQTNEAKYIDGIIRTWKPNVLIDVHEWLNASPVPGNEIEVGRCVRASQETALTNLASKVSQNSKLAVLQCTTSSNKNLFHRRYALLGYGAYLLETAAGSSYEQRDEAYSSAILTITRELSSNPDKRLALSPASANFDASAVSTCLLPLPAKKHPSTVFSAYITLLAGYALMVWLLKSPANREKTNWSHRFKKCCVEPDIQIDPMLSRHKLLPITSKSWVHRRLRSRYVQDRSVIVQTTDDSEFQSSPSATPINSDAEVNLSFWGYCPKEQ